MPIAFEGRRLDSESHAVFNGDVQGGVAAEGTLARLDYQSS